MTVFHMAESIVPHDWLVLYESDSSLWCSMLSRQMAKIYNLWGVASTILLTVCCYVVDCMCECSCSKHVDYLLASNPHY